MYNRDIQNGATVKINLEKADPRYLHPILQPYADGRHIRLGDPRNKDGYPKVLDDGSISFFGTDRHDPDLFVSVYDVSPTPDCNGDTYTVKIVSKTNFRTVCEDVIHHEINSIGVKVVTPSGETFYPWSFEDGIDKVMTDETPEMRSRKYKRYRA